MAASLDTGADSDLTPDMSKGYPAAVTQYLGTTFFSIINVIFITSSIGTVDSTFSCTAKLVGPELCGFLTRGKPHKLTEASQLHLWVGRTSILFMAVIGLLPLVHDNIKALSATTQTGTILMGLGPPLLFLPDLEGFFFVFCFLQNFVNPHVFVSNFTAFLLAPLFFYSYSFFYSSSLITIDLPTDHPN